MKRLALILLLTSLFFTQLISSQTNKIVGENNANSVALFWDTSLSMDQKNLELELSFLDYYIKDKSDLAIQLVKFSNGVISEKTYQITKADWRDLKTDLIQTQYDGATSFEPLTENKYQLNDIFLLFTDGYQNRNILTDSIKKPLIAISSTNKTFFGSLKSKAPESSHFLDLNTQSLTDALAEIGINVQAVVSLKNKINKNTTINNFNKVTGIVYSSEAVLEGVNVVLAGREKGTVTDKEGKFSLDAQQGDELIFSYLGFKTYHEIVSEPQLIINLLSSETQLSTVELTGKKPLTNKDDNNTFVLESDKSIGYATSTLKSDKIDNGETTISNAAQGKFSGATMGQNDDISQMIIRGIGSITQNQYPLIVIDGVPMARSNSVSQDISSTSFIDPSRVAKLVVLKGLAAANKYGSEGSSGVVEITTKGADFGNNKQKPIDQALVKNNIYKEATNVNKKDSPYLTDLNTSKSAEEAYLKYLRLRLTYGESIVFYFDVSDYFKQWNNALLSERILSNVLEMNFNNPTGLLALAFKYEANKDLDNEIYINKRLLRLRPKNAQSYIDMAKNYTDQKFLTKAYYLYKSMVENAIENMNFSGANTSLTTEFKSLIQNNQGLLPTENINPEFFKKDNINARLYFEWTSPDLAFEIQFVNPQNRFFSWTHSVDNDAQRIKDEKEQGFTSEEFLLIDAEKGEWLINLTNFSASAIKDQILKMVIYKNFGTPQQTKEVKLVNLEQYYQKGNLTKIKI